MVLYVGAMTNDILFSQEVKAKTAVLESQLVEAREQQTCVAAPAAASVPNVPSVDEYAR